MAALEPKLTPELEAILDQALEDYDRMLNERKKQIEVLKTITQVLLFLSQSNTLSKKQNTNSSQDLRDSKDSKDSTDFKEKKDTAQLVPLLGKEIPLPSILFTDTLPCQGGVAKPKDLATFAKEQGFYRWCDNIFVENGRFAEFQHMFEQELIKEKGLLALKMTSETLKRRNFETSQKIQLVNAGGQMGVAAMAAKKIKKGEFLFYSGEIKAEPNRYVGPETEHHAQLTGNANGGLVLAGYRFRNMANMLAHLPTPQFATENFCFENKTIFEQMATANFEPMMIWLEDLKIFVPALQASRDIELGEMLGWDYYPGYWASCRKTYDLFTKNMTLIPRTNYTSKSFNLNIVPIDNPKDLNATSVIFPDDWDNFQEQVVQTEGNPMVFSNFKNTAIAVLTDADKNAILKLKGSVYVELPSKIADFAALSKKIEAILCEASPTFKEGFLQKTDNWDIKASQHGLFLKPLLSKSQVAIFQNAFQKAGIQNYIDFKFIENANQERCYQLSIENRHGFELETEWNRIYIDPANQTNSEGRRCTVM